ncbi:oligoendopeptidase F [Mesoplasma lactucae]|uniref:Oligopeptidase F n=1 Tax=Mesoplasma lactucae ATCC 49193 TaxID=81460 RepID=A0A291IST5_9MOLU|nr:oligoendopeptidase F [Mesoplasma lactucae]ATG97788.1 oligoendopeptidase F [Mesoplasma lactucae ATCC 49193]ATZ20434.1 oligoendopeptidase F [Mesoplasma lactucae ATCC 49193]MCL8216606.1 Oligoendopeptidase F, plasmid [Mesoplasma lactucae ATCC 49193]
MKRTEATNQYKWDFSNLYKNVDEWKADLNKMAELGKKEASFKGKLKNKDDFKAFQLNEEEMAKISTKLIVYIHLGDTDQTNTLYQELEGLLMNVYQQINIETAWEAPELKEVGEETIMGWINEDKDLQPFALEYKNFFKQAKHVLSAHDEELLSKVARSRGAISGMYDSLAFADNQEQKIDYNGVETPVTSSFQLKIMQDSDPVNDQQLRLQVNQLANKGIIDKKYSFANVYEGIMQSSTESINLRGYDSVLQASLDGDNVPVDVYLKLLEVGKKYIKPFEDFSLITKKHFKLDKYYATDRQLKLVDEYTETYDVEEAQNLIKKALSVLGPDYLTKLDKAWGPNRIDFYEDTNKTSGAYSTGGNGVEPIILMNWDDKLNSVTTLAHESGHSVHTLFADEAQPYPLADYPIILAEVASTVNEHLLYDYLINTTRDRDEKIYLLQQRIFDLVSTFYRQIQFADFEYRAHNLVQQNVPQTAESLAKLFNDTQADYGYGVFDKPENTDGQYSWPRVSHFFHSPFYVYKYAIDVTASYKLYQDVKNGHPEILINFLKAGGSKDPLDIMMDAGIDFNKEETYMPLINAISDMTKQLEELLNDKNPYPQAK